MPDWIEQLLVRFFESHDLNIDRNEIAQDYARINFFGRAVLELNFIPDDESLLLSLRLAYRADQALLEHVLKLNNYKNQRPLYPSAHLFENNIVLRLLLHREQLDVSSLDAALNGMLRTNESIAEY